MNNKNKISERLKKVKAQYSYVEIAKRFETNEEYVYQIATGRRSPTRGKGLKIKKELEQLVKG